NLFIQRTRQIQELKSSLRLGLDDVQEWVLNTQPSSNVRINPFEIQTETGLSYKKVTAILLGGTLTGAFHMCWEYVCPTCRNISYKYHSLSSCQHKSFCKNCNQEFYGDLRQNIIVNFSIHPEILETNSEIEETKFSNERIQLTGIEVLHVPEFKEFFGNEVISPKEILNISSVAVLFTSIEGSTQLYELLGELRALELVREHFHLINEAVQANNGIMLKTIGDCTLSSFVNVNFAVHSMFKIIEKFKILNMPKTFNEQIHLKMGVYEGPVILLNMNDKIDYFGTTVNKAVRLSLIASGEEMCMTEDLFQRSEIQEILKIYGVRRVRRSKHVLKGLSENHSIIKIPTQP
ncbi:MAG: DUF5939 domain-containing protein, partial [Leptospiraceae bacterium]|nr:DUF5939 domain-containing protein [Leptospiraceae bacterium]